MSKLSSGINTYELNIESIIEQKIAQLLEASGNDKLSFIKSLFKLDPKLLQLTLEQQAAQLLKACDDFEKVTKKN